jgi:hypothetical protein
MKLALYVVGIFCLTIVVMIYCWQSYGYDGDTHSSCIWVSLILFSLIGLRCAWLISRNRH